MKITRVKTYPITLTVRPELFIASSAGKHAVSRYVLVALHSDEGLIGWGEATVVPLWSGESRGGAEALINDYFAEVLMGRDPEAYEEILAAMDALAWENHFTKAAVEMALFDLLGKKKRVPAYHLLGGAKNPTRIPIKFSIGLREPEDAARIAAQKVAEGFTALKIKVGPDPEKDLLRARLVREAAPKAKFNVDVNGGWSVEQAVREIPRYEPYDLEYVEQPTPRWDIGAMAEVRRRTGARIMADESVFPCGRRRRCFAGRRPTCCPSIPARTGGC